MRGVFIESSGGGTGLLDPPHRRISPPPPPTDEDEGGGDGRGDGGDGPEEDSTSGPAEFALRLCLIAISALFLVFLALLWQTRSQAASWPPPGSPAPPTVLWVSTLLLAASSASLSRAALLARLRTNARRWLWITLALGLGFLACQVLAGARLIAAGELPSSGGYGASFFALVGLHAVHVVGGLAYLTHLAARRRPGAERVRLAGMYWHFMGVLWLAVFALLWWPAGGRGA